MKKAAGILNILLFTFSLAIKAQPTAAVPMLEFNPNPQAYGLGMAGVSIPSNDPLGFIVNPAMIGFSSQTNNLAYQFYTQKTILHGNMLTNFNNTGITAGYNFSKLLNGLNLSAGVGYTTSRFAFASSGMADASGRVFQYKEIFDHYDAYGIGASLDYYVNLSAGLTFKNIGANLVIGAHTESKINAIDWGILLNVPISKLAFNELSYTPVDNLSLKPITSLSIGYSRSNIGDKIYYIDPAQGEPLPLTARLGYTFSLGSDLLINKRSINFFTLDLTMEAEDLLISFNKSGIPTYQGLLGDIKPGVNLLEGKGTDNVILREGQKLSLFETVSLLFGFYNTTVPYLGPGSNTSGIIISSNGILKLLSWNINENSYLKFIFDHIEIQYISASILSRYYYYYDYEGYQNQTDVKAVTISFNRFMF